MGEDLIERAASDLLNSEYAIVLTGAGMSTESGIPDFRGPKGIWTTDRAAEAKAYERYELFVSSPRLYWEEMLGGEGTHGAFYGRVRGAEPNAGHYALAQLESLGVVKCVVTQNIDGLHIKAGSSDVIEYHGSVHKLRCLSCGARYPYKEVSFESVPQCRCGVSMKLDVVHFGEAIPLDVMERAEARALECDLMLVCGTSAVVYPFAALPRAAKLGPGSVAKVIEINAEPTPLTSEGISDYTIRGMTGEILPGIAEALRRRLGDRE